MKSYKSIDCPSCQRKIADYYVSWLWKIKNCVYCGAPLYPVMDDYVEGGSEFYFTTDNSWK